MYRTLCVLALVTMYAGLSHSFSWEIVATAAYSNRLDFYDINGTLTHTENITFPLGKIDNIIYDPVHDRVLYADSHNIYSFEIATRKTECLIGESNEFAALKNSLAYDPIKEILFWTEGYNNLYSVSLKPGFNNTKANEKQLIPLDEVWVVDMTVDSCEGFIYYYSINGSVNPYERVRFDGSEREVIIDDAKSIFFDNDQKSHKLFWSDETEPRYNDANNTYKYTFKYSDLNGQNTTTIHKLTPKSFFYSFTASREFIYLRINDYTDGYGRIWKIPKNPPHDFDIESKLFIENDQYISGIATKYNVEDITRGNQNCDALKSLLPNNTVSTDASLICVHGTKVSGESRCECTQGYSGERCDVSVCHNYCLQGNCSTSDEGQPMCRCNAGYSGARCEVNACQAYCLNEGVCSLSEESVPVCQCTGGHEGDRCEVPVLLTKCIQAVSMLRDLLFADLPHKI